MSSSAQASAAKPRQVLNANVDLPSNAYRLIRPESTTQMERPKYNSSGRAVAVSINSYRITSYPTKTVYQYDITIGNGTEKRGLIRSVWESQTVKAIIGPEFIFDGSKIGWSSKQFKDMIDFEVDLDKERNIEAKEVRPPNKHRVQIRKTSAINLVALNAYLQKKIQFDNSVLAAINFLDHLLRETPSKKHIALKRSYFGRTGGERQLLGGGVEAMKGIYQSIRAAEGQKLVINADVSNTTFWHETSISHLAMLITGSQDMRKLITMLAPVRGGGASNAMRESVHFAILRRLCKNEIFIKFRNASQATLRKTFKIERISQYTARTHKFDLTNKSTGQIEKDITVEEYFKKRYNVHLENPDLPLLEVGKKNTLYPMEVCHMIKGQRYPYKLDEAQTAAMIRFAASRPQARKDAIQHGLNMLDWRQDKFLQQYNLAIEPRMLTTNARVLNAPEVGYANSSFERPGTTGRWNIRNKKFLHPNPNPLKSWGLAFTGRPPTTYEVNAFVQSFINIYRGHGGVIDNTSPTIIHSANDGGKIVEELYNCVGNANNQRPQLMFFVLPNKGADLYNRIKKSADCRFGVVSQCVQVKHLVKNQAQYHSNVCMKVNAKLGGTTCRVQRGVASPFLVPTMIIGADVSHAAPGSNGASFAAMTVSMDRLAARYAAAVETNGIRVEMISKENISTMLTPLILHWQKHVGAGALPANIYYFRDGVSEGQYQAVIQQEVADLKALFALLGKDLSSYKPTLTVVVAEKRHHIRFFPRDRSEADKNGNPVPGTLVERDVTHPFEYDFYLCSHAAIQGTARPTHYHILMDECNHKGDIFQTMLYEYSYQYMRSTTAVSLFPAVYYAHLASIRARSHLDISHDDQLTQKKFALTVNESDQVKPLIEMSNQSGILYSMWYI